MGLSKTGILKLLLSRPNIRYISLYMPYLLNYLLTARPQAARLHVVVCIFEGGLFYSLPLRERGRSSCPVKAFDGSGAEQ